MGKITVIISGSKGKEITIKQSKSELLLIIHISNSEKKNKF